ncbi:MAG TPA: hypothetical protein VM490_15805 [Armatimonadaceae bacterium]|nr:hypothetical protein [Armatimonadaceae bacterium]
MSESTKPNHPATDLTVLSCESSAPTTPGPALLRSEALAVPPEAPPERPVLTLVTTGGADARQEGGGIPPPPADDEEADDDLLSLVEAEAIRVGGDDADDGGAEEERGAARGEDAAAVAASSPRGGRPRLEVVASPPAPTSNRTAGERQQEDVAYRFPYSRAVLEVVPDIVETFCARLSWHRGKAILPLFESTALRPIAEVTRAGQKYPIFLSQHARRRRDCVVLGGRRKAAKSWRCALRCAAVIQGREDRFTWLWRVTATAAAMALPVTPGADGEFLDDAVTLALPLAPAKHQLLTLPGLEGRALVVWMHDIAISVVAGVAEAEEPVTELAEEGGDAVSVEAARRAAPLGVPVLSADARGVYLHLRGAQLGGTGTVLRWETWLNPARTAAEALAALLRHVADAADRAQIPTGQLEAVRAGASSSPAADPAFAPFLNRLAADSTADLMREDRVDKRGADKRLFRAVPGKADKHLYGTGADSALAACALLSRYRMTGDDALIRLARLLTNGTCEAQINIEESAHWGAVWEALHKKKVWADVEGEKTLSVATTARAAKGLHLLHAHFGVDLYQRTALHAAQWLMLKMDAHGRMAGDRFAEEGPPVSDGSPWTMVETLTALVETFRVTGNEVFLKTALRVVRALQEGLADASLPLSQASTEHLAAAIEGVLLVSREYESEEMIALAKQMGLGLRSRRLPDGSLGDPTAGSGGDGSTVPAADLYADLPNLWPTLAGARAALALARVDSDPLWPVCALRALRAAARVASDAAARSLPLPVSLLTYLTTQPTNLLLTVAQRAPNAQADLDRGTITRAWQTFGPDPATNEYIRAFAPGTEEPVDHLALVCPVTQQVLIAVITPPDAEEVDLVKNGRKPFVRSLLDGDYGSRARTVPLGDGAEARVGVYLADT